MSDSTLTRIDQLREAPDNLRQRIDGTAINEMARSLDTHGILQPLVVRPLDDEKDVDGFRYEVVIGHRRLAAAKKLGWDVVPVDVREMTQDERTEVMLIENLQRVDLTPLEEARGYFRLVERGMTIKDLSTRIGRSQKHVSGRLKLIELPGWLLRLLGDGKVNLIDIEQFQNAWTEELQAFLDEAPDEDRAVYEDKLAEDLAERGVRWTVSTFERTVHELRRQRIIDQVRTKAEERGIPFVEKEPDTYGMPRWPKGHAPLTELNIEPKQHRSEPCHGIAVGDATWNQPPKAIELCIQRSRHTAAGKSEVKPADIDEQVRQREEDKQRRELEKARYVAELEARAEAIAGAKRTELVDIIARWVVEWALTVNDTTTTEIGRVLKVDGFEAAGSANERFELLAETLAGASQAALLRAAAATTFSYGANAWQDPVGRRVKQDELLAPYREG